DLSGIFMDRDHNVIETLKASGAARVPLPQGDWGLRKSSEAAFVEFARLLDGATKLTAYVAPRASAEATGRPSPRHVGGTEALAARVRGLGGAAWALVVGINAYHHAERLNYAVADARAVAVALPGFGFETVRLLLDDEATKGNIERVIYGEFKERMKPEDRL